MDILAKVKQEFSQKSIFLNPHTRVIRERVIALMHTPGFTGQKEAEDFVCEHPHGSIEIFSAQLEAI